MSETNALLGRIAAALEQSAPKLAMPTDWHSFPAYVWDGKAARGVPTIEAPKLELLRGIDGQKLCVADNVKRLAMGHAAHDMLLWGARGMGKSALIRSSVVAAQNESADALALVQVSPDALSTLAALFTALGRVKRSFLVFIDDLGFEEGDSATPRHLRSWLEGGVEARPANVRIAVTSNRRAIVARQASEQDDPINARDVVDDRLALADRFGLSVGFHVCDQDAYLAIIAGYAAQFGLDWEQGDALEWSRRRGARSGRVAWHYVTELAGRAGRLI